MDALQDQITGLENELARFRDLTQNANRQPMWQQQFQDLQTELDKIKPNPIKAPNNSLQIFCGKSDEDFVEWFEMFELIANGNQWTNPQKLRILPTALRDTALDAYRDLDNQTKNNYDALKVALKTALTPADFVRFQSVKFSQRRQKIGESVTDFATAQ